MTPTDPVVALLTDLVGGVRSLVEEVRGLRADLADTRRPQPAPLSPADLAILRVLLPVIAGAMGPRNFLAGELYSFAKRPEGLNLKIAIGSLSAKQLGKLLRRAVGQDVDDFLVERVGDDGQGIWRVVQRLSRVR